MAPRSETKAEKPTAKKAKSTGGTKRKLSAFNRFMKNELARLKESEPDVPHKDRFKQATSNWATSKENPKAA